MDSLAEARQQLDNFQGELVRTNPHLYRHLALYLQVLRQTLLKAIQQAGFHLATQIYPERYCRLSETCRSELHRRIEDLVRRACALLTVEQVAAMAVQIGRQDLRLQREQHLRALQDLDTERGASTGDHSAPDLPDPSSGTDQDPAGSIHLGMDPPIDHRLIGDPSGASGPSPDDVSAMLEAMAAALDGESNNSLQEAGREMGHPESASSSAPDVGPDLADPDSELPWESSRLPSLPPTLLQWLEMYERALARRLRNLSHALNVEFLRLGLAPGLLPVSLLDAAMEGQVELQQAPPNLLRLSVPLDGEPGSRGMELIAILLRPADIELEHPQLRTCRNRLQHHRQEVRRMAQHFRRVQRRVRTLEAERLWLEDNRRSESHQT